mmetsp:Transcript_45147/g.79462  ORF Transcript_45147/g.79462 Transcript_45147/m.79462 type:complete len:298 (+) Transcript_45147:54-947(+)
MALPGMDRPGMDPMPPRPEWPGAVSAKFCDPISAKPLGRTRIATNVRNGSETSLARQGFGQYFSDTTGLIPSESKRIIECRPSEVFEWRPCKRPVSQPGGEHHTKPEGRRLVDNPPGKPLAIRERRHLRQVESKEEYLDRPIGPKTVIRDNGRRAADEHAKEVDLSYEMQRKVVHYDLGKARNGVGCVSLGDKAYRHPEYESTFFKAGGLIVGSTFQRGHFPKSDVRNSSSVQLVMVNTNKGPVKSFKEKEAEQQAKEARDEVAELTLKWESATLKDCDAGWENPDSDDEVAAPESG